MLLLIDNYDSFTWNLVQRFGEIAPDLPVEVHRNDRISGAEEERATLFGQLADPAVLRDGARVVALQARVAQLDGQLEAMMARWEELETIAAEAGQG